MRAYIFLIITFLSLAESGKKVDLFSLSVNEQDMKAAKAERFQVKKRKVSFYGVDYTEVTYENKVFLLRLLSENYEQVPTAGQDCMERPIGEPPPRIQFAFSAPENKYASRVFVESLRLRCREQLTWDQFFYKVRDLRIKIGLKEREGDFIKNKNLFLQPSQGGGGLEGNF